MRMMALVIGAIALACLGAALWLLAAAAGLYWGPEYAPGSAGMPGYKAAGVEADGGGIFFPGFLVLAVGVFLGKFALNLWRKP
ncbi:hypothetical protein [Acidovorax sp. Root267]|uniref:hypothetical protein n=1 Tax=Acidovorax sp. Root267 TaxID=1736505 RepID=UPI001124F5AE|nr:hypothetical protein [Acidovorax sp. Root267]